MFEFQIKKFQLNFLLIQHTLLLLNQTMILIKLQKVNHIFEMVYQLNLKKNIQVLILIMFQKKRQKCLNYKLYIETQLEKMQLHFEY